MPATSLHDLDAILDLLAEAVAREIEAEFSTPEMTNAAHPAKSYAASKEHQHGYRTPNAAA